MCRWRRSKFGVQLKENRREKDWECLGKQRIKSQGGKGWYFHHSQGWDGRGGHLQKYKKIISLDDVRSGQSFETRVHNVSVKWYLSLPSTSRTRVRFLLWAKTNLNFLFKFLFFHFIFIYLQISSDGHCLYNAVQHQLGLRGTEVCFIRLLVNLY